MYEFNGRQYLLVTATAAGSGGPGAPPAGVIAFALPQKPATQ
jgi:hypothetical protein